MLFITGNWWKPVPDDTKIQNQINDAIYEGYDN
ncbi:chitosanase, partial [Bacillus sp. B2-WWTP-C-10-Post-4]